MARIKLQMSIQDAVIAMCDGNPGCINVLMNMLMEGERIDPDAGMGGFMYLLHLDTLEVYGSRVWCLFKDVCREDMTKTFGVLRAYQLGIVSRKDLIHAIDNRGEGVDVDAVVAKVKERLPNFGVAA